MKKINARYIDNNFYQISGKAASFLCGGKLPKIGYEKGVSFAGFKFWCKRTMIQGKTVWALQVTGEWETPAKVYSMVKKYGCIKPQPYKLRREWTAANGSFQWTPGTIARLIRASSPNDFDIEVHGNIFTVPKKDFLAYFQEVS